MYSFARQFNFYMSLIKSVSGIRGTIGGKPGENLTPFDVVSFVAAYGELLKNKFTKPVVAIGRDGRVSGEIVRNLAAATLQSMGIDIADLDYTTTPSLEYYVLNKGLQGGIMITASHNPAEWNALKFLDEKGEFISAAAGEAVKQKAESGHADFDFATTGKLGKRAIVKDAVERHVQAILDHPLVDSATIKEAGLHVVADCINSTGNISIPVLLDALGVTYVLLNDGNYGHFTHNPEPLPEHLKELSAAVIKEQASLGISVDPDVDRLALFCENGTFFGEEYTLVCAADYILQHRQGAVVTNLSSSRALRDLALGRGSECFYAPVGEVHVVAEMKKRSAVLGGEGNGGVIDPDLHYGRDALMGIALILMNLATSGKSLSQLRGSYPSYVMVKDKVSFDPTRSAQEMINRIRDHFSSAETDVRDGLKIDFPDSWVHLRKSNTEPILRIYAEAKDLRSAEDLVARIKALM